MAVYNGTNGNDTLIGTTASDTFNPGLGFDTVYGGGGSGVDTLNVDYGDQYPTRMIDAVTYTGGAFQGSISTQSNSVSFDSIQILNVTQGTSATDTGLMDLTLDTPLAVNSALSLQGYTNLALTLGDYDATIPQAVGGALSDNLGAITVGPHTALPGVTLGGTTASICPAAR